MFYKEIRFVNNNKVYVLSDFHNVERLLTESEVFSILNNNHFAIDGLRLKHNGTIVEDKNNYINKLMLRLMGTGANIQVFVSDDEEFYYYVLKGNNIIMYFPDDVKVISSKTRSFNESIFKTLDGYFITLYGGKGLTNISYLFASLKIKSLNFKNFEAKNLKDVSYLFYNTYVDNMNLSELNTCKVETMEGMFVDAHLINVQFDNFNTSKVKDMNSMFLGARIDNLETLNFDTSNVQSMHDMFNSFCAIRLDLSKFDTYNVRDMSGMFQDSHIDYLDISNFNTVNVCKVDAMFYNTTIRQVFGIGALNFRNVQALDSTIVFNGCEPFLQGGGFLSILDPRLRRAAQGKRKSKTPRYYDVWH